MICKNRLCKWNTYTISDNCIQSEDICLNEEGVCLIQEVNIEKPSKR